MERGARVLVVDDQPEVRALLRDILEAEGYQVHEAADGAAGLSQLATVQPDLVILDHMMPNLTGLEVLRRIRADGLTTPVIIVTAYGDDATTWEGWSAGASYILDKPFDRARLLQWVERLLSDDPPPAAAPADYDLDSHRSLGDAGGDSSALPSD